MTAATVENNKANILVRYGLTQTNEKYKRTDVCLDDMPKCEERCRIGGNWNAVKRHALRKLISTI